MSSYIFAIIDATEALPQGLIAFADAPVTTVEVGGLAAVVCSIEGKLRPRRKNLAVHHDLVNALMEQTSVLPMAFGMLADHDAEVSEFLETHQDSLVAQLDAVDGRVEVGLKLEWGVDNIFAYFLEHDEELRNARDAAFASGQEPTREDQIKLGQFFASRVEAARAQHTQQVEEALSALARDIRRSDPRTDVDVFNLAFLVDREEMGAFEQQVERFAAGFDDVYAFRLTGALAPYSFVDVRG